MAISYISSFLCLAVEGLGLIPGAVSRFEATNGLRVPHIGWNGVKLRYPSDLLEGVNGRHVYFVHSYRAVPVRSSEFSFITFFLPTDSPL